MRLLKNKIAKALEYRRAMALKPLPKAVPKTTPLPNKTEKKPTKTVYKLKKRKPARGNNIMKNYSRAMVSFALSKLALPYLAPELEKRGLTLAIFQKNLRNKREKVHCIRSLRELLLPKAEDSENRKSFKEIFGIICEVFLKFFSVNWIFNSKLNDKMKYLKYRGKILRRVQDPEHFTYLESF